MKLESPRHMLRRLRMLTARITPAHPVGWRRPGSDEQALLDRSLDQTHSLCSYSFIGADSFHDIPVADLDHSTNTDCHHSHHSTPTPHRLSAITSDKLKYEQHSTANIHLDNKLNEARELVTSPNSLFASINNYSFSPPVSNLGKQPYLKLIHEAISDTLGKFAATDCAKCLTGGNVRIVTDPSSVTEDPDTGARVLRATTGGQCSHAAGSLVSTPCACATADAHTDCQPLLPASPRSTHYPRSPTLSGKAQFHKRCKAVKGAISSVEDTLLDSSCGCSPFFRKEKRPRHTRTRACEEMCGSEYSGGQCGTGRALHPAACCAWELRRAAMRNSTSERLESTRVEEAGEAEGLECREFAPPHAVPVLELRERQPHAAAPTIYQAYKGQLRVTVKVNYGLLSVHVEQARHLASSRKATCDSFVKMSLMPGQTRRTRSLTEVVPDTNHPVYDQRFSYELVAGDAGRRLCIAVYHRDARTRSNQLLGSMSFGIHDITNNTVVADGWYYLLADHLGGSKHLRVTHQPAMPPAHSATCCLPDTELSAILPPPASPLQSPAVEVLEDRVPIVSLESGLEQSEGECDAEWASPSAQQGADHSVVDGLPISAIQLITLPIVRGAKGYGLSINGSGPAYISRVEAGSPAERVGFKAGDVVMRVNHKPVYDMAFDQVARVIRYYRRCIVLEVLRAPATECCTHSAHRLPTPVRPTARPATPSRAGYSTPGATHILGDSLDSSGDSLESEDECYHSLVASHYAPSLTHMRPYTASLQPRSPTSHSHNAPSLTHMHSYTASVQPEARPPTGREYGGLYGHTQRESSGTHAARRAPSKPCRNTGGPVTAHRLLSSTHRRETSI